MSDILTQADEKWMKEQELKKERKIEEFNRKLIEQREKRQARKVVHITSNPRNWTHHSCLFCGKKGCIISLTTWRKVGNLCHDCYNYISILPNVGVIKP